MKKTFFLALTSALLLQLVSCSLSLAPVYTVEPADITLKVVDSTLTTMSVKVSVDLAEDNRYYYCNIVEDSVYRTYESDDAFMLAIMDTVSRNYEEWKAYMADFKESLYNGYNVWGEASFASYALRYGKDNLTFTQLEPDTHYVVYCFCVDPDERKPVGSLFTIDLTTRLWKLSDLGFTVTFKEKSDGAFITVTPTNDYDSYIWDFAEVSYMEENYKGNVTEFLIDEYNFYQSFGWLSEFFYKGISGRDVSGWMYQPDTFLLVVGGYDGGFTTPIFTDTVIYPFQIDSLSFRQ